MYAKFKSCYFKEHEDGIFVVESLGDENVDLGAHSFALILAKEMGDKDSFEKLLSYSEKQLPAELMANMLFCAKTNVGYRNIIDADWPGVFMAA